MGNLWTSIVGSSCRPRNRSQLSPEEALREENNVRTRSLILETLFYTTFFILIVIMSYNNRDMRAFKLKLSISNCLDASGSFNKIIQPAQVWSWAQNSLVPFLHPDFNSSVIQLDGGDKLLSDTVSYRIGPTRFRQHRARDETCSLHSVMKQLAVRCSLPWSAADRDWEHYGTNWTTGSRRTDHTQEAGEIPGGCGKHVAGKKREAGQKQESSNAAHTEDLHEAVQNISSAWIYRTWADIGGLPITGNLGLYPPGGYVVDIDGSRNDTVSMLTGLQSSNWVDNRTRVLLVELTLYSPNVNMFAKITAVFEFPQAEVVMGYLHIHPFRLFIYLGNFPVLHMIFDYLVYAVTVWFVFRQADKLCHQRLQYFKRFWNIIEMINLLCSVSVVILHVGRYIISKDVSKEAFKTTGQFYNFQTLAIWDELFGFLVAFVCFMATLQILNLLRFSKRMSVLGETMMRSARDLLSFMLVFVVMLFAFLCFSYVTYGAFMKSYRTTVDTFESLLLIGLGRLEYQLMNDVSRVLTPAFIFLYLLFIVFILLNMLVSILTDSFAEVREDINNQPNDYELIDYIVSTTTFFMWRYRPFRAVWAAFCKAGLFSESEPASIRKLKPTQSGPSGQIPPTGPHGEQMISVSSLNMQATATVPPCERAARSSSSGRHMSPSATPRGKTTRFSSLDRQLTPTAPPREQTPSVASSYRQKTPTAPFGEQTPNVAPSYRQKTPTAPFSERTPNVAPSYRQKAPTALLVKMAACSSSSNRQMYPTLPSGEQKLCTASSNRQLYPPVPSSEQKTSVASSNRQMYPTVPSDEHKSSVASSNRHMYPPVPSGEQKTSVASSNRQMYPTVPSDEQKSSVGSSNRHMYPTVPSDEQKTYVASSDRQNTPSARRGEKSARSSSARQMTPTASSCEQTPYLASSKREEKTHTVSLREKISTASNKPKNPKAPQSEQETPTQSKQKRILCRSSQMNYHQDSGSLETLNKTISLIDDKLDKIIKKLNVLMKVEGVRCETPNAATFNKIIRKSVANKDHHFLGNDGGFFKPRSQRRVSFNPDVQVEEDTLTCSGLDLEPGDPFCSYKGFCMSPRMYQRVPELVGTDSVDPKVPDYPVCSYIGFCMSPRLYQRVPELANTNSMDATSYHNTISPVSGANTADMYKHPLEVQVEICDRFQDCSSSDNSSIYLSEFMYSFHEDSGVSHEISDACGELYTTPEETGSPCPDLAQTSL